MSTMKSTSTSHNQQHFQRSDISLKAIYRTLQEPHSESGIRCSAKVASASAREIDHTLRKLLSYKKHNAAEWTPRKLARCLNFLFTHGIKPHLQERSTLPSFKECRRWMLHVLRANMDISTTPTATEPDLIMLQYAAKFLCNLMETLALQRNDMTESAVNLRAEIRQGQGVKALLHYCQSDTHSLRIYAIRALNAQAQHFIGDLVDLNAFEVLCTPLSTTSSLLSALSFKPQVTDAPEKRAELGQHVLFCRLLESLIKYDTLSARLNNLNAARLQFAKSMHCANIIFLWKDACFYEHQQALDEFSSSRNKKTTQSNRSSAKEAAIYEMQPHIKNQRMLTYSLTTIVQRCVKLSSVAAGHAAKEYAFSRWIPLLYITLSRWVRDTCCTMNTPLLPPSFLDREKRLIIKLVQILLDTLPTIRSHMDAHSAAPENAPIAMQYKWRGHIDTIVYNLTNFFMAYVSQPILPEQARMFGESTQLIHPHICIDVEERGYRLEGSTINSTYQDLTVLMLEALIQTVQLASEKCKETVASRIAWCLKSILTILLNANLLPDSPLQTRLSRLVVFFLHYEEAISMFAEASTNISDYVWSPTIRLAKDGLLKAVSLSSSPSIANNYQESSASAESEYLPVISKAKRAFVALELISRHPRACERLVDCQVLQLTDVKLIPPVKVMQKYEVLLPLYALYGRFVAALCRRMAFIRARLRDEYAFFAMIIKFLEGAIHLKDDNKRQLYENVNFTATINYDELGERKLAAVKSLEETIRAWNHVITSCLLVISSFQFDEKSMALWLSCSVDGEGAADQEQHISEARMKGSVLPSLLSILLPWRDYDEPHTQLILEAILNSEEVRLLALTSYVLSMFVTIPSCTKQLILDPKAVSNLGRLLITVANTCDEHYSDNRFLNSLMEETGINNHNSELEALIKDLPAATDDSENNQPSEHTEGTALVDVDLDFHSASTEMDNSEHLSTKSDVSFDTYKTLTMHLLRVAIYTLYFGNNLPLSLTRNCFTIFFQPLLRYSTRRLIHEQLIRLICTHLYSHRMQKLIDLYNFTKTTDASFKLHEMTSIALGYAVVGECADGDYWNNLLGFNNDYQTSILDSGAVFSIICQMLIYELVYDNESIVEEDSSTERETVSPKIPETDKEIEETKLKTVTNLRRDAAAQVIEIMSLNFYSFWETETNAIPLIEVIPDPIRLEEQLQQTVRFVTDDAPPDTYVLGERQLLRARSAVFEALLSTDYIEAKLNAIPIHDIKLESLQQFVNVIERLNNFTKDVENLVEDVLPTTIAWLEIIDLITIADRFGSHHVKALCEVWIVKKVQHVRGIAADKNTMGNASLLESLGGMLHLFRRCHDAFDREGGITSDTWPFATVLKEALKCMVQNMSTTVHAIEFQEMVKEPNGEQELDIFCNAIAKLITKQ